MNAVLILSDRTILRGVGFGAQGEVSGEVVFNTSMVGYEESLTDPSYSGQILALTYPLIGNYGVRNEHLESDRIQVQGFIVKEVCPTSFHRCSAKTLDAFLKEHKIPGICGIDTRLLVKKIRASGVKNGILAVSENPIDESRILRNVKDLPDYGQTNFLAGVSVKNPVFHDAGADLTVCLIDTGVKHSIIRNFLKRNVNVWQMPHNSTPNDIISKKPDGIFIPNGPGDPTIATDAINVVRSLHPHYPIAGICLGNQIIALAFGAKTYKLPFGHRGTNQPVKDHATNRVYITSQNHGFAVDPHSLKGTGLCVSHSNLNDGSVEGVIHEKFLVRGVQMHPEANPGPQDMTFLFDEFIKDMRRAAHAKTK